MSSFICEKCQKEIIDTDNGYVTGCKHYEPDIYPCFNIKCKYYDFKMIEQCSKYRKDKNQTKTCDKFISFDKVFYVDKRDMISGNCSKL